MAKVIIKPSKATKPKIGHINKAGSATEDAQLIDLHTGKTLTNGWLDDIVDFSFGSGGTVTMTFTRNMTLYSPFTIGVKALHPGVTILENKTDSNFIDNTTQWVVYYPFQHCIGNFGVPFDAGYTSLKNALLDITGGIGSYTSGNVFTVAAQPGNYWVVDGIPGHPVRQWVDWVPNGGYSGSFRGKTALASVAQDYSNFLNEGYPNQPFGANNGAFAYTICDYERRERITIKVKITRFDANKPAFELDFSVYDGTIQKTQDFTPSNPKKPGTIWSAGTPLQQQYGIMPV